MLHQRHQWRKPHHRTGTAPQCGSAAAAVPDRSGSRSRQERRLWSGCRHMAIAQEPPASSCKPSMCPSGVRMETVCHRPSIVAGQQPRRRPSSHNMTRLESRYDIGMCMCGCECAGHTGSGDTCRGEPACLARVGVDNGTIHGGPQFHRLVHGGVEVIHGEVEKWAVSGGERCLDSCICVENKHHLWVKAGVGGICRHARASKTTSQPKFICVGRHKCK